MKKQTGIMMGLFHFVKNISYNIQIRMVDGYIKKTAVMEIFI